MGTEAQKGTGRAAQMSRAAEYRKKMVREVTLAASGMKVQVKAGSMMAFIYGGSLPSPMLSLVKGLTSDQKSADGSKEPNLARLMDLVLVHYVLEPKLVAPEEVWSDGDSSGAKAEVSYRFPTLADDQLGTWELLDADKLELFSLALTDSGFGGEASSLFRAVPGEPQPGDGSGPAGAEVSPAAK